ncbi:hypothetical protein [Jeotgalibacillus soli]|uniref:Alcohol dehydrogenase n=1 Tax=Jeotgalibacillus soli TaxID=889306 RepID=A0A0C2VVQ1_9BACL|nr:hypothetical protein [Jeotgalibacillus soli]KIL48491.1 hypothetical protein KP78_15740 [Jeotgalibacillus soli]
MWKGRLFPSIHRVYMLDEIAEAQHALEERQQFGEIVIKMS